MIAGGTNLLSDDLGEAGETQGDSFSRAPAFSSMLIQECGDSIIDDLVGSCSNIVGLPLKRLNEELSSFSNGFRDGLY